MCFFLFCFKSTVQLPGTQRGWATWLARWLAIPLFFYVYFYMYVLYRVIVLFLSFLWRSLLSMSVSFFLHHLSLALPLFRFYLVPETTELDFYYSFTFFTFFLFFNLPNTDKHRWIQFIPLLNREEVLHFFFQRDSSIYLDGAQGLISTGRSHRHTVT